MLTHPTLDQLRQMKLDGMAFRGLSRPHWGHGPPSPFIDLQTQDSEPGSAIGPSDNGERCIATGPNPPRPVHAKACTARQGIGPRSSTAISVTQDACLRHDAPATTIERKDDADAPHLRPTPPDEARWHG